MSETPAKPAPKVDAPKVEDAPKVDAPKAGLCEACFPGGAPEGSVTVGCEHGTWTLA